MYSFYTKKDDPFNFSYLNAAYNYNAPTTTTTNKVTTPSTPAPQPTPQPTPQPSYTDSLKKVTDSQTDFYNNQAKRQEDALTRSYEASNQALNAQVPQLENRLKSYQDIYKQNVADQEQYTADQKQQLEDSAGKDLYKQAQAAREGRGRLQNLFAGLGTVDSSAFQNFAARQEDRLATGQDASREQLGRDTRAADRDLTIYKQQAQIAEMAEVDKFNDAIRQINSAIQKGTIEYQTAVQAAYDKANEAIFGIQSKVAEREADYNFELKKAGIKDQAGSAAANANKDTALTLVNRLVNGNTQALSGAFKTPNWLASSGLAPGAGQAKADWEGISNLLALAKRGELKGQGTITDQEQEMLAKAARAGLDPNIMTEQEFLSGLKNLQRDLQISQGQTSGGFFTIAPDGQQIQIVD